MAEETLERRGSVAAPLVFAVVMAFHVLSWWFDRLKKGGSMSAMEVQLRGEIRELLKEASALSQPSTFAQAAKLRRLATAKEKELAKIQESRSKEIKNSYDLYLRVLFLTKVFMYFVLICWFWKAPIAMISQQLVQPFGRLLSWGAGSHLGGNVMVGIIPWLILSTRVSRFVVKHLK
ncbi:hypothetical protein ACJRO7_034195 [Eucalyptus globulus]|uniref:Uncharacterized protein n=1 Tax=Eucalyptus globulus TaxID=34317 RepID=A0ABD3JBJ1_EUCGL